MVLLVPFRLFFLLVNLVWSCYAVKCTTTYLYKAAPTTFQGGIPTTAPSTICYGSNNPTAGTIGCTTKALALLQTTAGRNWKTTVTQFGGKTTDAVLGYSTSVYTLIATNWTNLWTSPGSILTPVAMATGIPSTAYIWTGLDLSLPSCGIKPYNNMQAYCLALAQCKWVLSCTLLSDRTRCNWICGRGTHSYWQQLV